MRRAPRKATEQRITRVWRSRVLVIVGLATIAIGCSPEYRCGYGSGCMTDDRSAVPLDSCELLTQSDVEAVYGSRMQPGAHEALGELPTQPSPSGYVSICAYFGETDGELAVFLAGRQSYSAELAMAAMEQDTIGADVIGSIGDAARWSSDRGQLHILKGNTWFVVRAEESTTASDFQNSARVADLFLARL